MLHIAGDTQAPEGERTSVYLSNGGAEWVPEEP